MQIPRQKPEAFPCFDYCILAPGYKIKLKTQSQHCFLLIVIALVLRFICPIWFTGCRVLWHGRKMWRGFRRRKRKIFQPWRTAASHDTFSYLSLIYSLSQRRPECFYLRGDKETSISTQLKPVTVYSVTLRRKGNCIPSPGAHWDKSQTRCCGLRSSPSPTRAHPPLLTT